MAINKFNSKDGYSISDPPVALIDNTGNYTTTTGSISAVGGTFTGDVSAAHFSGDFLGELQVDCKNISGSIIAAGTPVYITGTVGATNVLEVSPADANSSSTMPAVGLTSEQLAVNGTGHITIMGVVQNMNTNSYVVGQTLYVAVGGGLTNVKPTGATELIQNIGKVGRVNANNGEIIVTGPGRTNDVPNTISITGGLTVGGDLTVNGTTTNINTTNLVVEDKNIILGDVSSPTDTTADGGGITLKGTTDKTFNWIDSTDTWTSSEHIGLASGKEFYINGSSVLNSTTLGSGVINSSLTTLGTISSNGITFNDNSIQYRAPQGNRTPGYIATVNVVSAAGVVSSNQINYYGPEFVRTGSANSHVVVANRIYFNCIYLSRKTTIRRIRCQSGNTVTTGNIIFGIYSNNNTTGFPDAKLYESASIAVGSGYTVNVVNNDSGLITLQPGFYHLAAIFSSTPIMFGCNGGNVNYSQYGSREHGGGYQNYVPWIDNGSYALPSNTSSSTFYFHDAGITGGTAPLRLDFGVIA